MKKNKTPPLVLLEWVDSAQPIPNWTFLSDFDEFDIIKCTSVGWLINDGKNVKALAQNLGNTGNTNSSDQVSGVIRIPACCVTRRVNLKESK